jgi:hypothetical protein
MKSQSESEIGQLIQLEAPKRNCTLLRNNSGAFQDTTGRVVRFGLGAVSKKHDENIKSVDYIGITTVAITQEMVGKKIGIFTAVETKAGDWNPAKKLDKHEQAQKNFIDWVTSRGGIAGFANSVDSYNNLIDVAISSQRIGATDPRIDK